MRSKNSVRCRVGYFRSGSKAQDIEFSTGTDLSVGLSGDVGPYGITMTAADLIDFAIAIYEIERHLRRSLMTNPPTTYELTMQLRDPKAWNSNAIMFAQEILWFLGNASWSINLEPGLRIDRHSCTPTDKQKVDQVALFSGGLDSTCGLATIRKEAPSTRLVFFSTGRKALQKDIAQKLRFKAPVMLSRKWEGRPGSNRKTFYYRSFLFLCLAAAVAESWKTKRILQFENGVLASALPPSPAWMMTKHAHPQLHRLAEDFFSALLGGEWHIENPFLFYTKRECLNEAIKSIGRTKATDLMQKTMTCWYHWANRVVGGNKRPGTPCGVCIPCIMRRTALQDEGYQWNLCKDHIRNDTKLGMSFRSYFGFLDQIARTKESPAQFYMLLPTQGRTLVGPEGLAPLKKLHRLFLRFSEEFVETYQL